jgi:SAM-dependent MidA family methyltransferase
LLGCLTIAVSGTAGGRYHWHMADSAIPLDRTPATQPGGKTSGPALGRIRGLLREHGRLTFAAFMAEALYGPDGYYTRRPRLGGDSADFFTSPELHPAFGALLGRLAARVWAALGQPDSFDLVEYGPGTGVLCRDLLIWADHAAPAFATSIRYRLIETSPVLQAAQRDNLVAAGLLADDRVSWGAGEGNHAGLILANELVDALPVHLVVMKDGILHERYVVRAGDGLGWLDDAPSTPALAAYFGRLGVWPGDGCIAEVNLHAVTWMEQAAATLDRGALLLLDYGYPAPELYAPERRHGTLLTYRGHALGSDPLRHVGEQDITAHVDFTSLARAGERAGLETVGLIGQAALLRRLGLNAYLRQLDGAALPAAEHEANRRALLALIEPSGLGNVQGLLQTGGLSGFDPFVPPEESSAGSAAPDAGGSWLPVLHPGQMRLPGPLEAEGFIDLEAQWQELFSGSDGPDEPPHTRTEA